MSTTPKKMIRRFAWPRLVEHHVNALAFIVLVITGMAQKFHDAGWAEWVIATCGGIDNVRSIHRITGLVFSIVLVQHVLVAAYLLVVRKVAPTMMIDGRDFANAIQNLRYYFGISDKPARCDRYDYKQKFEYWGVIMGGVLMVATGFLLWYPTALFEWFDFLPGQLIPAAKVAHSYEAMMAFLIIVTWHIYDAVFSPEVFPFDTAILHGKISEERMKHEHPIEYERMIGDMAEDDSDDHRNAA